MKRREFLRGGAALTAVAALPHSALAQTPFAPRPDAWRKFEVTTRVEIVKPAGKMQVWLPLPAVAEPGWIEPLGNEWTSNGQSAQLKRDTKYGAQMLHVEWADGERTPVVQVVSRIATRDRAVDLSKRGSVASLSADERKLYTASTDLMPTDGIVKATADNIVGWTFSDVEKARRIYEWIVDNTFRDPKTRGSDIVSKSQHCRAEVYLSGFGWVPVDPADVRKVVLEEPPGQLALDDPKVVAARKTLFGAWEMNWLAYNFAHDVELPGSSGPKLGFLMYPQAEVNGERLDSLDPDTFKYEIKAKEIPA